MASSHPESTLIAVLWVTQANNTVRIRRFPYPFLSQRHSLSQKIVNRWAPNYSNDSPIHHYPLPLTSSRNKHEDKSVHKQSKNYYCSLTWPYAGLIFTIIVSFSVGVISGLNLPNFSNICARSSSVKINLIFLLSCILLLITNILFYLYRSLSQK